MQIKFVSESKLDQLLEAEFEEFGDTSPQAAAWKDCLIKVHDWLIRFSHDEDAVEADGSPGFLLEDIWQGVMTMGIEFNDPTLLKSAVLDGLVQILERQEYSIELGISCFLPEKDGVMENMECLVIRQGVIYAIDSKAMKKAMKS